MKSNKLIKDSLDSVLQPEAVKSETKHNKVNKAVPVPRDVSRNILVDTVTDKKKLIPGIISNTLIGSRFANRENFAPAPKTQAKLAGAIPFDAPMYYKRG